jgi:hypothetical protein
MRRDVAVCPMCRVLPVGEEHERREGHIEHRQAFLNRLSYPATLLVAVVFGFVGALVAISASEAVKTKQTPPEAFRVEMAKPPHFKTPARLIFL